MRRPQRLAIAARLAGLALSLAPAISPAAPGPHLSWDHCSGDGQVENKTFACGTNTGSERLVVSYESPLDRFDRTGVELTLHITAAAATLPPWWLLLGASACRPGALTAVFAGDAGSACTDPYRNLASGGVAVFQPGWAGPYTLRILAAIAVPGDSPFAVGSGVEDFAIALDLSHDGTIGAGGCAGCDVPLCIGVGFLDLVSPDATDTILLTAGGPNAGGGPANVTWQGARTVDYTATFDGYSRSAVLDCAASTGTPTRRSTWGAVKSLYR
jgi:hypothetical protein